MGTTRFRFHLEVLPDGAETLELLVISRGLRRVLHSVYALVRLESDFGAAWRLYRLKSGQWQKSYDVLVDGRNSSCECPGFLRHGHCKHLDGIKALRQRGLLRARGAPQATTRPSKETLP